MGLLGYNTISLTDLTEVLPASLYLSSSLTSNSQTKRGSNYTPDFSSSEIVITPSLFVGTEEVVKGSTDAYCPYRDYIYYQCGELDSEGNEITYSYSKNGTNTIWVDENGRFHYKKNLEGNITIEAWAENWSNGQSSYSKVVCVNPVNVLLLTENSGYSALMTSSDGREYFEEGNEGAITLNALLYSGANQITEGNGYTWYRATAYETSTSGERTLTPLSTDSAAGIVVNGAQITIQRKAIKTLDTFICQILTADSLSFRVSMNIMDKTDTYFGNIISDGSLILTPQHESINLSCQLWSGASIINEDNTSDRFKYEWYYMANGSSSANEFGTTAKVAVDLSSGDFPRDSFMVYCKATVDGKIVVVSNIAIQYSLTSYNVQKRPDAFFIPSTNTGGYYSSTTSFTAEVTFSLVGLDGLPLNYNTSTDVQPSFDDSITPFSATVTSLEAGKWNFKIVFTYDPSKDSGQAGYKALNSSFYLPFTYTYLSTQLQDSYVGVKNAMGADGISSYTVYLNNEFISFNADKIGELSSNAQTYKITPAAYYGVEKKVAKVTDISTAKGIRAEIVSTASGADDYINVSIDTDNISSLLNAQDGTISVEIKVDDLSFTRTITYSVRFSSVDYYLQCSENSFIRSIAATYSPLQITASAYYKRNGNDTSYPCTSGYIISKMYGDGGIEITGMGGAQNIQTVGNQMVVSSGVLGTAVKYIVIELRETENSTLLDSQTIPVLVDSGDIDIGGVNLLRYSQNMPTRSINGKDYWHISNASENIFENSTEDEFKIANLSYGSVVSTWKAYLFLQSMDLPNDGFSAYYTISFDVYSDDYSAFDNDLYFTTALHGADGSTDSRWRWQNIQIMNATGTQNGAKLVNGERSNGKWARIAYTFSPKLNSDFFNLPESPSADYTFDTVKYISFAFWCSGTDNLKIKKVKLEKGNIPTDWSKSPYDVEYDNIDGANLLPSYYATKVYSKNKSEGTEWNVDFESGNYTLSWDNSGSFSTNGVTILRANKYLPENGIDFKATSSYTFTVTGDAENTSFVLYTNSDDGDEFYSIYQLKLEKGAQATPFSMSAQEIREYYENYLNGSDGAVIQIMTSDNGVKSILQDDLDSYTESIENLNKQYEALNSSYTNIISTVNGLSEWESYYTLDRNDTTGRTELTIGDKSGDFDFKMKLDSTKMSFMSGTEEAAYISNDKLFINYGEIVQQLRIGSSENTGYLVFKHMSGGLGVIWEDK